MYRLGLSLEWTSVALQIWILALIARGSLLARFPLYSSYLGYTLLRTVVCSALLSSPQAYFYVYWITAPIEVLLTLLAVHESFMKVFGNFYLLWWFRFLFPSAIIA